MPIVIRHDPSPAMVGEISYAAGRSRERKRLGELAADRYERAADRQQRERMDARRLQTQLYSDERDRALRLGLESQRHEQQLERYQVQDDLYRARDESQQLLQDVSAREAFVVENLDYMTPDARAEWGKLSGALRGIRSDPKLNAQQKQAAMHEWIRRVDEADLPSKVKRPPTAKELFEQNTVYDENTGQYYTVGVRNGVTDIKPLQDGKAGSGPSANLALRVPKPVYEAFQDREVKDEWMERWSKYNEPTGDEPHDYDTIKEGAKKLYEQERQEQIEMSRQSAISKLPPAAQKLAGEFNAAVDMGYADIYSQADESILRKLYDLGESGAIDLSQAPAVLERMLGEQPAEESSVTVTPNSQPQSGSPGATELFGAESLEDFNRQWEERRGSSDQDMAIPEGDLLRRYEETEKALRPVMFTPDELEQIGTLRAASRDDTDTQRKSLYEGIAADLEKVSGTLKDQNILTWRYAHNKLIDFLATESGAGREKTAEAVKSLARDEMTVQQVMETLGLK